MKKTFINLAALIGFFLAFASCNKDDQEIFDPSVQFDKEKPIIKDYVNSTYPDMEYSSDSTGIWFEVIEPGVENSYTYKMVDTIYNGYNTKMVRPANITVRYTGSFIPSGVEFDANQTESGMSGKTNDFISAWYFAFVPKSIGEYKVGGLTAKGLQKGTKIRIATPSYFAYGNVNYGKIPANSPLYFEIEVIDIK